MTPKVCSKRFTAPSSRWSGKSQAKPMRRVLMSAGKDRADSSRGTRTLSSSRSLSPASLSRTLRVVRWKRRTPRDSSRRWMQRVRDGWLVLRDTAAWVKLRCSARARKERRWRIPMSATAAVSAAVPGTGHGPPRCSLTAGESLITLRK
ncbi:hypothetical protein SFUMM280S_09784 [Streptomyces fumanus]